MSAPSPEEVHLYYYDGIRPGPKLIARSSTHVWELSARISLPVTEMTHPRLLERFFVTPAEGEELLLMDQVLHLLAGERVRRMTMLHFGNRTEDWQTVLLIDVDAGTLDWEDGYDIAMQCKALMEDNGIYDVECEIREAVVDEDGQVAKAWQDVALACQDDVDNIEFWA